ncbi:MAG: FAD:protein FMN transferase [Candidatus Methylacidiphilales bacterium]|nr:FAD:protein FMN transferase [Candidatus Methylacidiphilales bacterium]
MKDAPLVPTVVHRHEAMATWFEVRLATDDPAYAAAAAREVFRLVDRCESLLSRYREDSEICQIGRLSSGQSLRLSLETFACLRLALDLSQATHGAFDPALGAPEPDQPLPEQRGRIILDGATLTATLEGPPVHLDLGAIGKGHALDLGAAILREWEMDHALLVAGGSSLLALETPPGRAGWEIGLSHDSGILLNDAALGASGGAVQGPHILDPRTGQPAHRHHRTWAHAGSAAEADALSTAAMLLTEDALREITISHPAWSFAWLDREDQSKPESVGTFPLLPHA